MEPATYTVVYLDGVEIRSPCWRETWDEHRDLIHFIETPDDGG